MKFSFAAKAVFLLSSLSAPTVQAVNMLSNSSQSCTIHVLASKPPQGEANTPNETACKVSGSSAYYILDGDIDAFFASASTSYILGQTQLSIPTHLIGDDNHVNLDDESALELIEISQSQTRGVEHKTGTWKVLVLRVIDSAGVEPSRSVTELGIDVFDDKLNLRNSFEACTNDQLHFIPATGDDVVNGVYEVKLDRDIADRYAIVEAAIAKLPADGSIDPYTFTVVIEPPSVEGFGAVAWAPGKVSWYWDTYGSDPTYLVHELGHNLGAYHSSYENNEYGDPSCMMGAAGYSTGGDDDAGRLCFNAAKTYYFGWFSDYHAEIRPATAAYAGELVGTNDVVNGEIDSGQVMIVKVSGTGKTDLFMMYSKTEGITADVDPAYSATFNSHVVIVEQSNDTKRSFVKASLAAGDKYTQSNWGGGANTLTVEVCSITSGTPDKAQVIVYVTGRTNASCDVTPTMSPVVTSTSAPNFTPTGCKDSPLNFLIKKKSRSCAWVANNKTAKAQKRCKEPGVESHCPVACASPVHCTADSTTMIQLKENDEWKSCKWVRNKDTVGRCNKSGMRDTCRATCADTGMDM